jgi:hypothetical protein
MGVVRQEGLSYLPRSHKITTSGDPGGGTRGTRGGGSSMQEAQAVSTMYREELHLVPASGHSFQMDVAEMHALERTLVERIWEAVRNEAPLIHRLAAAGSGLGSLYVEYLGELDRRRRAYAIALDDVSRARGRW